MEVEFPKGLSSSEFLRNLYHSPGSSYIKKSLPGTRGPIWLGSE